MTPSREAMAVFCDIEANDVIDATETKVKIKSSYLFQNLGQMSGKSANDNSKKIKGDDKINTLRMPRSFIRTLLLATR
jgi:hypothetical protein